MYNNFVFNNVDMPIMYPAQQQRVILPVQQHQQQYQYQYQYQTQFYQQPQYFQQPQFQQHQNQYQQRPQQFPQQFAQQLHQRYAPQYRQQYPSQHMQHPQQHAQQYCQQPLCNQQLQYPQQSPYHQQQPYQQLQQLQLFPQHTQHPQCYQQSQLQHQRSHVQHHHMPTQHAGMLPIQQKLESFEESLGDDLPFPIEQQPNHLSLVGASQDAPIEIEDEANELVGNAQDASIEIDDEVEPLTQNTASTPESQKEQPATPGTQATPCTPVLEKPKNSWYTQLYGQQDSNGNMRRLSVEDMARNRNVRASALKGLTKEDCAKRMFEEDLAKATKITKQKLAKELGLANPKENEEDEEDEELVELQKRTEEAYRPASLKRKSAEADIEGGSSSEPASKKTRTATEQEQISAPIILASGKEDLLTEDLDALFEDEEIVAQHADLEVEQASSSDGFHATPVLPSIEPTTKGRRAARPRAPRQRPNKKATKKAEDASAPLDTLEGPSTKEAEEEAEESTEAYNARMAVELQAAFDESDGEEAEESKEAYNARVAASPAAKMDAEMDEDEEEEFVQRARSASVSSDEDENDDYIGNRKYGR